MNVPSSRELVLGLARLLKVEDIVRPVPAVSTTTSITEPTPEEVQRVARWLLKHDLISWSKFGTIFATAQIEARRG